MKRRLLWGLLAAMLPWLAGCVLFVAKADYADYRAIRLAPSEPARLLAMRRYMERHPEGTYAAQVQGEREQRDAETFDAHRATRKGLELYLAAFPDGRFVTQARERLAVVEGIEAQRERARVQAEALVQARKERDAELRRTWITRFVGYWLRSFAELKGWGRAIGDVAGSNPEFSLAFGRIPRPRCTAQECVKYYGSPFGVPIPGGTRLERTMRLTLRLWVEGGRLQRADLLLPAWGFSRWSELEQRAPVIDAEPLERTRAVEWALAQVQQMLAARGAVKELGEVARPQLPLPAIPESGEITDVTAIDPSAPPNVVHNGRLSPAATAAGGPSPEEVRRMLVEEQPEGQADMVMDAIGVDRQGREVELGDRPADAAQGAAGGEMTMAPLEVSLEGAGQPGASTVPAARPADFAAQIAPAVTRVYEVGGLRVTVFAAGTDAAAPAFDGLSIEKIRSER
ncbi:MAG: hypothetical protein OEZ06_06020 [Myxococcales bacterium]|nr:hypothetical protein [Myxococcales bacterium]